MQSNSDLKSKTKIVSLNYLNQIRRRRKKNRELSKKKKATKKGDERKKERKNFDTEGDDDDDDDVRTITLNSTLLHARKERVLQKLDAALEN